MSYIRIQSIATAKTIYRTEYTKIEAEKYGDKDSKSLYKLIKNPVYGKTMDKLKNRIEVRLVNNQKIYLKWTSKPSFMLYLFIWCNSDLVVIP